MAMYKQINDDMLILSPTILIIDSSNFDDLPSVWTVNDLDNNHNFYPFYNFSDVVQTPQNVVIPDPLTENVTHWARGHKRYELTNHLGNVLATVSDRKLPVYANNNFSYYKAEVMTANDYYAFGMVEPKRGFDTSDYRFGYNTQEKVDEIAGKNNHYTADYWEYDPRIGRRWNVEPFSSVIPWFSPYSVNYDNPNIYADELGDIPWYKLVGGYTSKSKLNPPISTRVHPKLGTVRPHHGVDMAASQGTIILAAAGGKVVLSQWVNGYGWTVIIDHGKGFYSLYGHMPSQDAMLVTVGQNITNGQAIGKVGQSGGVSTGPHLHVEYMYDPKNRHSYFSSKSFNKNQIIFNPMGVGDLQDIVSGTETNTLNFLDGNSTTVNATANDYKPTSSYDFTKGMIASFQANMNRIKSNMDFMMKIMPMKFSGGSSNGGSNESGGNGSGGGNSGGSSSQPQENNYLVNPRF